MDEKLNGSTPADTGSHENREIVRQAAVYASGVLNMGGDPALQQLVEETAVAFRVPMAAVSIIDRDRQWFPACVGMDMEQTSRDVSFCAHAIEQPGEVLTVLNATRDPRFAANPLVTGEANIRFYLGCPILDRNGRALGSLCVIDVEPREHVDGAELTQLREFAQRAADIIGQPEVSASHRKHALDSISAQIEELVRAGDESIVDELDAMLRRIERQEDKERQRKS
ncbi:GAF domain-containing protein [Sphingomonas sp. IC-11]|uniref:GAF domain-containing protein n=1 Tax=Sphingomonas sp. IC-11 TaxID=2898528 RepID=UPI001E30B764|nr:GAF domain-containing protein [Sphingomonas sp. IC-11]MCD2317067.1 GAF domain-containing protein [Sphingomonas sp. IC-11]